VIFRRRQRRGGAPPHVQAGATDQEGLREFYHIEFDMMVKGRVIHRRSGPVRQFGVTVDGSTRLVTSGETVDRQTYKALLAAGALRPNLPQPEDEGIPASLRDEV